MKRKELNLFYNDLKKIQVLRQPKFGKNYLAIEKYSSFQNELFRNFEFLNLGNCFSVLRTNYMMYKPRFEEIQVHQFENEDKKIVNSIQFWNECDSEDKDLLGLDGLRFVCFLWISILVVNFLQKDLVQSNRWKDLEILTQETPTWVLISTVYIQIDYLFLFSAFLQSNKLYKHFKNESEPKKNGSPL